MFGQEMDVVHDCHDSTEISSFDFTSFPDFNALKSYIFGIRIGMSYTEVRKSIANFQTFNLSLEQDKFNATRYYLYERISDDSIRQTLANLIWNARDPDLKEIQLFPEVLSCLNVKTDQILSCEALEPRSAIFNNFLGYPSDTVVELDIPSIRTKSIRYYYPQHSIIINENINKDFHKYSLIIYNSRRIFN